MAQDRTSISLTRDTKEDLTAAKTYPDEPWEAVLRRLLEHYEVMQTLGLSDGDETLADVTVDAPAPPTDGEVADAVQTIEERTGRLERQLEDLQR